MEKRRIEWIDIAKGFGVILVMLGHTAFLPSFLPEDNYIFISYAIILSN